MQKLDRIKKYNIISGSSSKSNLWTKFAFSSVLVSTSIGIITNILNIYNSTKQKTIHPQEPCAKIYTNLNENLNIKFF